MKFTIVEGLYFGSKVLGTLGPTGGYNLKIAFYTSYLAGRSVSSLIGNI